MPVSDINTSWEKIRRNVKEAEILIGQKKYNLSMVKSRQALEGIVLSLCDKAAVVEPDLASSIDALYSGRWISKTSCEHYHKIRMLGNKAVHEGSDDAYEANQAYHLISQEAYTYSHEYNNSRKSRPAPSQAQPQPRRRSSSGGNKSRRRRQQGGIAFTSYDVARLVFLSLVLVLIIVLIAVFKPKDTETEPPETTPPVTVEETSTVPETSEIAPETMAPTTAAPVYKTIDNLNVRSQPSTDGNKLATLPAGTVVEFVRVYENDSDWTVIIYNDQEAYVASRYLTSD